MFHVPGFMFQVKDHRAIEWVKWLQYRSEKPYGRRFLFIRVLPSFPRKRESRGFRFKVTGFPLKDCGNDGQNTHSVARRPAKLSIKLDVHRGRSKWQSISARISGR